MRPPSATPPPTPAIPGPPRRWRRRPAGALPTDALAHQVMERARRRGARSPGRDIARLRTSATVTAKIDSKQTVAVPARRWGHALPGGRQRTYARDDNGIRRRRVRVAAAEADAAGKAQAGQDQQGGATHGSILIGWGRAPRRCGFKPRPGNGSACRAIGAAIPAPRLPGGGCQQREIPGDRGRQPCQATRHRPSGNGRCAIGVLAVLFATALPGCAADSFGAPQWRDNADAPAWRRHRPRQIAPAAAAARLGL